MLSNDDLRVMVDNIKVGQIYKCIEDRKLVMIALVRPKEIRGYLWDEFQVVPYVSLAPLDFVRYFELTLDPHIKTAGQRIIESVKSARSMYHSN